MLFVRNMSQRMALNRQFQAKRPKYNSATNCVIATTFGREMQSDMLIDKHGSKSKPVVEFCYSATEPV